MELKRKYREVRSEGENNSMIIKPNGWFRKNFSLAGLYYHLAKYGEDLRRPTFFWLNNHISISNSIFVNTTRTGVGNSSIII
jgi:hypothetical protein